MKIDCLIIGGGIAGLWTLSILRKAGFNAWLVENHEVGGGQSIASQGIIHGGTKYALGGKLGDSARAIGDMPAIWNACLKGDGEIDLSNVEVHTRAQLMWSTRSVASKVAGFFADKLMQSRMQKLDKQKFPEPFDNPAFQGDVYQLNEPVLNTASLMSALFKQLEPYCLAGTARLHPTEPNSVEIAHPEQPEEALTLYTQQLVLSAGEGNEKLLEQLQFSKPVMQRRPIHMVVVRSRSLPSIFAHCLGAGTTPRLTITTTTDNGYTFWYIGGGIAETGVTRQADEQIQACRNELQSVLPWLDFTQCQWSTLLIDRAEISTAGNKRPDSSFVGTEKNVMTVWPTKLAFAPKVAASVLEKLQASGISPDTTVQDTLTQLQSWPRPGVAKWPWLQTTWKSL